MICGRCDYYLDVNQGLCGRGNILPDKLTGCPQAKDKLHRSEPITISRRYAYPLISSGIPKNLRQPHEGLSIHRYEILPHYKSNGFRIHIVYKILGTPLLREMYRDIIIGLIKGRYPGRKTIIGPFSVTLQDLPVGKFLTMDIPIIRPKHNPRQSKPKRSSTLVNKLKPIIDNLRINVIRPTPIIGDMALMEDNYYGRRLMVFNGSSWVALRADLTIDGRSLIDGELLL